MFATVTQSNKVRTSRYRYMCYPSFIEVSIVWVLFKDHVQKKFPCQLMHDVLAALKLHPGKISSYKSEFTQVMR